MPYDVLETSAESGAIVELYEFSYQARRLRYVSGSDDVVFESQTFTAAPLERSAFEDTSELPRNDLTIACPDEFPVAQLFAVAPPSAVVLLQIFRWHFGDTERRLAWSGRVLNARWTGSERAELACESIFTALRRPGLRRRYTRGCPHELYGNACRVENTLFQVAASVLTVTGAAVTAAAFATQPDGWFSGGYLEWESSPGIFERRAIRAHVGTSITLTHPIVGLVGGASVRAFAGCDHSIATCASKFGNAANYGGFPYIPRRNPFGSGSVF